MNDNPSSPLIRRLLLALLLAAALVLALWRPVEIAQLLAWGEQVAEQPLTIVVVILSQIILLALALPGSMVMWVVAPFYPPPIAVAILLTGSVLGALGGYWVSHRLGSDWRPPGGAWLIDLLARRGDFFTQCALRVLPGCPHWAANYGAGILRLPLIPFTLAAVIGLGIKWSVYCWAIYGAVTAARTDERFDATALLPLAILAILLVVGSTLRSRLTGNAPQQSDHANLR